MYYLFPTLILEFVIIYLRLILMEYSDIEQL